ncbi:LytTR family DNA-binding domain-containing protein [Parvularcula sp. LCG005]|uniref:LytR/AlgR family response regulator transcription factor n=1 Tax=Parvularcula sp. LCG005 TaxID=3078805 RepID=UPI0029433106|nr:LytTR family DNA-binding domain-containing protein [Parvularcula sp. LCG005]WOI52172.1 LytTR family DNA-binding domain-containing protein [Parvularcula sp. LCG005]
MSASDPHRRICALVVDDEAPARARLCDLLGQHNVIDRIDEAANGVEAIEIIRNSPPDIVFLDVRMPVIDGFGVIDAIGSDAMPLTIFVTAYDQYALQAFDANAVDYLVKPFTDARFAETISRVISRTSDATKHLHPDTDQHERLASLLRMIKADDGQAEYLSRFAIKSGEVTKFVATEDIDWIQAAGVYVNIYSKGQEYLFRSSLTAVLEKLDPGQFCRIHRSAIINLSSIAELGRRSHGEFDVTLVDGTQLIMSRTYKAEFERTIGQSL